MGGACSRKRGEEEYIEDIGGKARRKEPLGRPRRRWVDNIKMDLKRDRMTWCGLDWYGTG
jgi:hypothetical protein